MCECEKIFFFFFYLDFRHKNDSRGRPIIATDIKHFYDYRYRSFKKTDVPIK